MKVIKRVLLFAAGLCWLLFAAVIGLILIQYFTGGVGGQGVALLGLSSLTVALGLGQVIGFIAAGGLCVIIGVGLCIRGLVPASNSGADGVNEIQNVIRAIKHGRIASCPNSRRSAENSGLARSKPSAFATRCGLRQSALRNNSKERCRREGLRAVAWVGSFSLGRQ